MRTIIKFSQNFSSYTSSVCHLSSQIDKLSAEIPCWRQKLRNAYKNLDKTKAEIKSSKYANFLQIYLKYKNLEVQNSKKSLINKHITAIDTELSANTIWLQKTFNLATQIIKNGSLNTQQRYHYDQLEHHLNNAVNCTAQDLGGGDNSIHNGTHPTSSDEEVDQLNTDDMNMEKKGGSTCNKRLRMEEYDLDDIDDITGSSTDESVDEGTENGDMHTTFKMPAKRPRNLNETHVLTDIDTNGNATFYMGPSTSTSSSSTSSLTAKSKTSTKNGKVLTASKSNIVSNIISDQMVKATSNADQLKNGRLRILRHKT